MSDPMTNTEVEDVLASIRRLVSDDKRPDAVPAPDATSDRLVLTPSLRVMEDAAQDTPDAGDSPAEESHAEQAAQIDAAVGDTRDMAEMNQLADVFIHESFAEDEAAFDDDEPTADVAEAEPEPEDVAEPEPATDEVTSDDEGRASFEAGNENAGFDEASDDTPDEAEYHAQALEVGGTEQTDQPEDTFATHEGDVDEVDVDEQAAVAEPDAWTEEPQQTLSEKIAALETLVAGRNEQFEPDDAGTDAYAGTEPPAMAWEDADADITEDTAPDEVEDAADDSAFVATAAAATTTAADKVGDADTQIFSGDEDVLDEDALRELVSDIVREELQGALGERITRNVRKLVRREIHRALAAQELE